MPKELVCKMGRLFNVKNINYPMQIKLAKNLLNEYKRYQIEYALQYFKESGLNIYSLGYLNKKNMKIAITTLNADMHIKKDENSGKRNKKKIENGKRIWKTEHREDYPFSLFEECEQSNCH